MTEDRKKEFQERMKPFPSHFNLEIKLGFTAVNRRSIIKRLSDEMEISGFELKPEQTSAFNLLSFLHWRIKDNKNAKMYSEKALQERENDVMALANLAWMHSERSEFSEKKGILEKLEQLKDRRDLMVISKAEQAFAYSWLGPRYYTKAIELFEDVIDSAKELKLEETYLTFWKFGLGLSLKRQLHYVNVHSFQHLRSPVDSFRRAIDVLLDVAQNATTPIHKARGWVALGELADSIHNHKMLSLQSLKEFPKEFTSKKLEEFFDTALSICDNDVYVLERCGRQARYSKDYDRSINLFKRSIEIRGTSLSHHHLAKAIRSTLNKEIGDKMKISHNHSKTNGPFKNGWYGGYNKLPKIQNDRRNVSPDCEQIKMTDSLTAKCASVTMSDSTSSASLETNEHREPQRQTSNTFSACHQTRAVETDLMNNSRNFYPTTAGGQTRKGHSTYGRCSYGNSFSHLGYQKTLACQRERNKVAQGNGFRERRGKVQKWGRNQSSDPSLQRCQRFQDSTSSSEKSPLHIRSPKKVLRYDPNDERVEEIRKHLEKSLEYAPSNYAAQYDIGLLFRSLGRLQDAVDLFIEISSEEECSPWQAVLCMEQQALCLQEIAEAETEPNKKKAMNKNVEELLFEAMEQAARIATRFPCYQPRGIAFPSLKEMLLRQTKGKNYDRDDLENFARLYELIGKYGHALSFYKQISEMSEKDSKDPEILMKMAQNYVKQRDFRNSLLFFDLIETSCTRLVGDNRKLYFKAYLEGAICALEENNMKEAKTRFKRTVRFCSRKQIISEYDDEDCPYDIHIQTSESAEKAAEESGKKLFDLLANTCGLKVSLNENQAPEELNYVAKYDAIGGMMEQSCLIIFIYDDADLQNSEFRLFTNMAINVNIQKNLGAGIISIFLGILNVPVEIKSFPVFLQPQHFSFPENRHETYQWLREFFWKAAEQTFPPSISKETDKTDSD